MRYPKATLRRTGQKMMTANIKLHFGIEQFEAVFVDALSFENDEDRRDYIGKTTKSQLWERVMSVYMTRGINWFPEGNDIEDIRANYGEAINEKIFVLFPELLKS